MAYIKIEGETTAKWLERLIAIGAPADVRADVRTILAFETAGIFPSVFLLKFHPISIFILFYFHVIRMRFLKVLELVRIFVVILVDLNLIFLPVLFIVDYQSPIINIPTAKRSIAKQDSFRKKLSRIRHFEDKCDICSVIYPGALEAAHIVDHSLKLTLETAFLENDKLPSSVNHEQNGLMLCPTCHLYFDKKIPEIRIKPDGTIAIYGKCSNNSLYAELNGTKVHWVDKIGDKNYPSAELLSFALKLKPGDKKRIRELIESEDDEDDEDVPAPRKSNQKKAAKVNVAAKKAQKKAVKTKVVGK